MYYQVKHPSAWVSTQVAYILYVYKINFKVTTYATKMALNHETDSWDFSGRVLPKHTTQAQLCFHWVPWHEVKYQAHNERVCWLFFFFWYCINEITPASIFIYLSTDNTPLGRSCTCSVGLYKCGFIIFFKLHFKDQILHFSSY